jgi:RNA methyltransferase, TrmH family
MQRSGEIKISGLNAVLALVDHRIDDVIRVYLTEERIPDLSALLKHCAAERKAYHVVPRAELDRVAESVHHEGVCVLAKRRRPATFGALTKSLARDRHTPATLVLLDDVKNPHNIGAIVRIAAHFGARALLLPDEQQATKPSSALLRTAEGGAESVDLVHIREVAAAIETLVELGFRVVATSSHARDSIYSWRPSPRTLVLLGSEGEGLSKSVFGLSDAVLTIPGTGAVESLNVASAAAIVLSEIYRARESRGKSRH